MPEVHIAAGLVVRRDGRAGRLTEPGGFVYHRSTGGFIPRLRGVEARDTARTAQVAAESEAQVTAAPPGSGPVMSFLAPGSYENRWSDLLATLVATDPAPLKQLLHVEFDTVRREVAVPGPGRSERLDLLLVSAGTGVAAIEAKLLSDLGPNQLDRYLSAFAGLRAYAVLHLGRLPVDLHRQPRWKSLTWETVLGEYSASTNTWVATTAAAWIAQLDALVPAVGEQTVWNDVPDDAAGMELALRARIAWLANRAESWCDLEHDMAPSSGGGNWAVQFSAPTATPDLTVTAELQEGMTAYEWRRDPNRPYRQRIRGPVVLVCLRQDTDTSEHFNWDLLHRMFATHVLDRDGQAQDGRRWQLTSARPSHPVDQAHWQAMVAKGAPRWLGKGWGMKVAAGPSHGCMFGARIGLPPTATLLEIDQEFRSLQPLVTRMAATH